MAQIAQEITMFWYALLAGVLCAALYDVFRILRMLLPCGRFFLFLEDLIYCLLVTLLSFLFYIAVNDGKLRGFLLAGQAAGFLLYFLTVSPVVLWIGRHLVKLLRQVFGVVLFPLRWLGKKLGIPFVKFRTRILVQMQNIHKKLKIDLKKPCSVVYNKWYKRKVRFKADSMK